MRGGVLLLLLCLICAIALATDINNCTAISSSGSYQLVSDVSGAPVSANEVLNPSTACIKVSANNVVFDCNGYVVANNGTGGTTMGIVLVENANFLTLRNCPMVANYTYDVELAADSSNNTISNVTVSGANYGIYLYGSAQNNLTGNTAYNNSDTGFFLSEGPSDLNNVIGNVAFNNSVGFNLFNGVHRSYIADNDAFNNTDYGFALSWSASSNTFFNNTVSGSGSGFSLSQSSWYNDFLNNEVYDCTSGFYLSGYAFVGTPVIVGNVLDGNIVHDNSNGFYFYIRTTNNNVTNNSVYGNSYGIYLSSAENNTIFGNSVSNSSQAGLRMLNSGGLNVSRDHYFNNSLDIWASSAIAVQSTNISFVALDSPGGGYANYTNISIVDSLSSGDAYAVRWSSLPPIRPGAYLGIAQKFVNISNKSAAPSIDSVVWQWIGAESAGYEESKFNLLKYNGTWSNASAVLDIGARTLTMTNMVPGSVYGIMQGPGCQVINSSGTYVLYENLTGAPNNASELGSGYRACAKITAPDTVLDCNGYSITNNATANAAGITANNSVTNLTVRNCIGITNYTYGVFSSSNYSLFANNSGYGNYYAFYYGNGYFSNVSGSTAFNNTFSGFQFQSPYYYSVSGNTAFNNTNFGILFNFGTSGNVTGNTVYNNNYGISASSGSGNRFERNNASSNNYIGIRDDGASGDSLVSNYAANNSQYGFSLDMGAGIGFNNIILNNTAQNNSMGFMVSSNFYTNITNNTARDNSNYGFFNDGLYCVMLNNTASNNSYGFYLQNSYYNNLTNNTAFNSISGYYLTSANYGTLAGNRAFNNSGYGIQVVGTNSTNMTGDRYYNNGLDFLFNNSGSAPLLLNVSGAVFDNPLGGLSNFTNLSISDSVSGSSSYSINWSSNSSALPADHVSFARKYANISGLSGTVSIDSVTWTWLDSEATGYADSRFEVWRYNGSWSNLSGVSRDASANTLSVANLDPASVYGVLQYNLSCVSPVNDFLANASTVLCPGTYNLPDTGATGVIIANANNLVINCTGTMIVGGGSGTGVYISGKSNVTVSGCYVSNYTYGFNVPSSAGGNRMLGNTITNTSSYAIYLNLPDSEVMANNIISRPTSAGIYSYVNSGTHGYLSIANNTISGPSAGASIYLNTWSDSGSYNNYNLNNVIANNAMGNSSFGTFFKTDSSYGWAYLMGNTVANNSCYNSSTACYYMTTSGTSHINTSTFTNNTAGNTTYGISMNCNGYGMSSESFINNTLYGISGNAIYINGTASCVMNNSLFAYNNMQNVAGNSVYFNWANTAQISNNTFRYNNLSSSSVYGVYFNGAGGYYNDFSDDNTFNGYPFYHYYKGQNLLMWLDLNATATPALDATNLGLFTCVQCSNVTTVGNFTGDRNVGVVQYQSSNSLVSNSTITRNALGAYLYACSRAGVQGSVISGGTYGVQDDTPASGATISDNRIGNTTSYGIYVYTPYGDFITNNTVSNATSAGIYSYLAAYSGSYGYATIANNTVSGPSAGSSIYVYSFASNVGVYYNNYNNITGNAVGNSSNGIQTAASSSYSYGALQNSMVANNTCSNAANACYYIYRGGSSYVSSNFFANNSANNASYGMYLRDEGGGGYMNFNTFRNHTLANISVYGINMFESTGSGNMSGNSFIDTVSSSNSYGVVLNCSSNSWMTGNTFTNNAFSSTSSPYGAFFTGSSRSYYNDFSNASTFNGQVFYHYYNWQNMNLPLSINATANDDLDATNLGLFTCVQCSNVSVNGTFAGDRNYGVFLFGATAGSVANSTLVGNPTQVYVYGASGVNITNNLMYGGSTAVSDDTPSSGLNIQNNAIIAPSSYGIYINLPYYDRIVNNSMSRLGGPGIYSYVWKGTYGYGTYANNTISGPAGGSSVYLYTYSDGSNYNNYNTGNLIWGNGIGNSSYGVYDYGTSSYGWAYANANTFANNTCYNATSYCYYMYGTGTSTHNSNVFANNSAGNATYGIYLQAGNAMNNNVFQNNYLNATAYPLYLTSTAPLYTLLYNTTLENGVSNNYVNNPGTALNFSNLTFRRLGGSINLPNNYSTSQSMASASIGINTNAVALDNSSLAVFNGSRATIGIFISGNGACPAKIFKKSNFATNNLDIIANGTRCNSPACNATSCDSGYVTFNTATFSGYAASNNTPPSATAPVIVPPSPVDTDTLNASAIYTDLDNDPGYVTFAWYVNNLNVWNTVVGPVANGTNVSSVLSPGNFTAGNYVNVSVQANDTLNVSDVFWSDTKLIAASCTTPSNDLVLTNDTLLCGGTYFIPDTGAPGIIIAGANGITITCLGTLLLGNGSGTAFNVTGRTGVGIYGCGMSNYTNGIHVRNNAGTGYSRLYNNVISNMSTYGVFLTPPYYDAVVNNSITNAASIGIYLSPWQSSGGPFGYATIENNTISGGASGNSIYVRQGTVCGGFTNSNNNISNNAFGNTSIGIILVSECGSSVNSNRIVNNTCTNASYNCYYLFNSNGNLNSNLLQNNTCANSYTCNYIYTVNNPVVNSNSYLGFSATNVSYGVQIIQTGGTINSNTFSYSSINNSYAYPIHLYSTGGTNFYGNTFSYNNITAAASYAVYFNGSQPYYTARNDFAGTNTLDGFPFYHYYGHSNEVLSGLDLNATLEKRLNATNYGLISIIGCSNFTLAGSNLSGDPDSQAFIYNYGGSGGNRVVGSTFYSRAPLGIFVNNPMQDTIAGNIVIGPSSTGIYAAASQSGTWGYMTIANNTVGGSTDNIYLRQGTSCGGYTVSYNNISNNVAGNSSEAFLLLGECGSNMNGNGLSNNTCQNATNSCFELINTNGNMNSNVVSNNSCDTANSCYYMYTVNNPVMNSNSFSDNTGANAAFGVKVLYQGGQIIGNSFTNNSLTNMSAYGIHLYSSGGSNFYGNSFSYNRISNVPSYAVYFNTTAAGNVYQAGRNDFGGTNTLDGFPFYHYYGHSNEVLSGLDLNATLEKRLNATNYGLISIIGCSNFTLAGSNLSGDPEYEAFVYNYGGSGGNGIIGNSIHSRTPYGVFVYNPTRETIAGNAISGASTGGVYATGSQSGTWGYMTIENNTISGGGGSSSIRLQESIACGGYTVSYNNVSNNAVGNSSQGVFLVGQCGGSVSSNRIINNTCQNMTNACYYLFNSNGNVNSNLVANNTAQNASYGLYFYRSGGSVSSNTLNNNTILSASSYGIYIAGSVSGNTFNNSFVNSSSYPVYLDNSGSSNTIANTILNDNASSNFISNAGASLTLSNITFSRLGGSINLPNSYSVTQSVNTANTAINDTLASLNNASLVPFNGSAATIGIDIVNGSACPARIFKKSGFSTSDADVIANGSRCMPPYCNVSSCIFGYVTFSTATFSGYAASNNTPPGITAPAIAPASPIDTDTLNASAIFTDMDNDSGFVLFKWYVNSVNVWNYTTGFVANGTNVSSILAPGNFSAGDYVNVSAQSNDTLNVSDIFWSDTKLIAPSTEVSSCMVIQFPGQYRLIQNLTGAPNAVPELGGFSCIVIRASDAVFDCSGFNVTNNGTANSTGVFINATENVTVRNCPGISNYSYYGIFVQASNGTTLFNNSASLDAKPNLYLNITNGSLILNNTLFGSSDYVAYLLQSSDNRFENNTLFNGADGGAISVFSDNNTFIGNTAYNITGPTPTAAFRLWSSRDNYFANNLAHDCEHGFYDFGSNGTSYVNNTLYGDYTGFENDNVHNSTFLNNTLYGLASNGQGFYLAGVCINTTVAGNRIFDSPSNYGYEMIALYNSFFSNNTISNSTSNACVWIDQCQNLTASNNNATKCQGTGFQVMTSSSNVTLLNNIVSNFSDFGFYVDTSIHHLTGNTARDGGQFGYGFYLYTFLGRGNNNILNDNIAANNSGVGLYVEKADNTSVRGMLFANNGVDFHFENLAGESSINLSGAIFSSPAGIGVNSTNISIVDIANLSAINVNWSNKPAGIPTGFVSFGEKYINITRISGTQPISSVIWSWQESELTGYNESRFGLWKFNSSGWANQNATLDIAGNSLSLGNLNPASVYAILQLNDSTPPHIVPVFPDDGFATNTSAIIFNFSAVDDFSPTMNCSLFIDGSLNQTNSSVFNDTPSSFAAILLPGFHNWSIRCTDFANNTNVTATRNLTIDILAPSVQPAFPPGDYGSNTTSVNFTFSVVDQYASTLNCSLFIDGNLNQTNESVLNSTPATFIAVLNDGWHTWSIACRNPAGSLNSSATRNLVVDTAAAGVFLQVPAEGSYFNISSIAFNFTARNTFSTTLNCSLFIDGTRNMTNSSVLNNTLTTFNSNIAEGRHSWYVTCTDIANSTNISETRNLTVALTQPSIALGTPADFNVSSTASVPFNFTVVDSLASPSDCSLYIDGIQNDTNTSVLNNTPTTFTETLAPLSHTWFITCTDLAGNTNTSATRNLYVHTLGPSIQLNSPASGSTIDSSTALNVTFNFTVSDDNSTTVNCSVYIDAALNYTNDSIANGSSYANSVQMPLGSHNWSVSCSDSVGNYNSSPTYGFTISQTTPPYIPPSEPSPPTPSLSISYSIIHPANMVVITTSSGAEVRILLISPYSGTVASGTVGPDGSVSFTLSQNGTYRAIASKTGYNSAEVTFDFTTFSQPPQLECTQDSDCPMNTTCTNNRCVPLPPVTPGNVTPPQPPGGGGGKCSVDGDCATDMYCAPNKECKPVTGRCGFAANHTWNAYECCEDKDCSKGYYCSAQVCKLPQPNVTVTYDLAGTMSGFVGDNASVQAYAGTNLLPNNPVRITAPDGSTYLSNTDSKGNVRIPLLLEGDYAVELLVNGTSVKTLSISSLSRNAPVTPPQRVSIFEEIAKQGWLLLIIAAVAVGAFILWRFYKPVSKK